MFEPKFTYTDRLVWLLIKLENNKTTLQNLDLSYNVRHKLGLNAKSLDMFHLSNLLGLEVTLKDGEKLSSGIKPEAMDEDLFKLVQNMRNILEFNRSNMVDTYAEFDTPILLHLNKLMLNNWKETWESKFRTGDDIADQTHDYFFELSDETQPNSQIQQNIYDLVEWYKDVTPTLTPVVRIGILIFRLIDIYPFLAGNYLTLIALLDYLLLKYGLASRVYMSVVRNFDINNGKFLEAFFLSKKNYDLSFWLEAFVDSLNKELNQVRENINEYIIEDEKSKKQPFLDLNKRQLKVLRYLQSVPMIKREDYCHMMEVSTMTAFRDLNDLVRKRLLKVEGEGRGTKYRLASM
jgi:Fic family protein